MNRHAGMTTLRARLLLLVGAPLLLLLLTETVISYLVGMHSANQVFDSWLLDSAHSIAQEVRDEGDGISFIAADDAVEMFEWDEIDNTYFHIAQLWRFPHNSLHIQRHIRHFGKVLWVVFW